jgi:hypothetical protein
VSAFVYDGPGVSEDPNTRNGYDNVSQMYMQ